MSTRLQVLAICVLVLLTACIRGNKLLHRRENAEGINTLTKTIIEVGQALDGGKRPPEEGFLSKEPDENKCICG